MGVTGGTPLGFNVGAPSDYATLPGLDLGVRGMRVGGQRKLLVPPNLVRLHEDDIDSRGLTQLNFGGRGARRPLLFVRQAVTSNFGVESTMWRRTESASSPNNVAAPFA